MHYCYTLSCSRSSAAARVVHPRCGRKMATIPSSIIVVMAPCIIIIISGILLCAMHACMLGILIYSQLPPAPAGGVS